MNFNPRSPCGLRQKKCVNSAEFPRFQSTQPMRAATSAPFTFISTQMHFNPRSPCGLRLLFYLCFFLCIVISIHAAHAGCDLNPDVTAWMPLPISIHAAHAGCDDILPVSKSHAFVFQSTQPMRAATFRRTSIRSDRTISIHAAHAGCD